MKRASAGKHKPKQSTVTSVRIAHEDHETIRQAAEIERRSVTSFLVFHGLQAARQIIDANRVREGGDGTA